MRETVILWIVVAVLLALGASCWAFAERVQDFAVALLRRDGGPRAMSRLVEYVGSPKNLPNIRIAGALIAAFAAILAFLWIRSKLVGTG